jgi:ribonucleotide reductase beta subunit family protein with ferritin-like domain
LFFKNLLTFLCLGFCLFWFFQDIDLFKDQQEYVFKVAENEKDACGLVEAGFEYVTEMEGSKIFGKRKQPASKKPGVFV